MATPAPPLSLHHLEQLITGLTAGVILIDPSGVILRANPAALHMHGVRCTADLGATADEYCERFSLRRRDHSRLARRDYPIMRLLAGESIPDMVVEVTPIGEHEPVWTHAVHDVVMDEDGGEPDCLALVIQDVSERYDAEARFEAMFQANPAPAAIVRLADQRYVRVNQGFLELTGYEREEIVGRNLRDVDILARAERRVVVAERLSAGTPIPQVEAELPLPDGTTRLVVLAGQPIEVANEPCMLFTFADLEPRRKAERTLRASERRFAAVFEMAPVGMVLTTADDHRILQVNDAFRRLSGYASEHLLGRVADDLQLWSDASQRAAVEEEIRRHKGVRNHDVRVRRKDGEAVDCLLSAEAASLDDTRRVLWLYQDISSRRHSELQLVEAIEAVMKDATWFSRSIMDKLAVLRDPVGKGEAAATPDLSQREREVLEMICEGMNDRVIAETIGLSHNTVRNHVSRLYAKIGVNRRSAAVIWARERGIGGRAQS